MYSNSIKNFMGKPLTQPRTVLIRKCKTYSHHVLLGRPTEYIDFTSSNMSTQKSKYYLINELLMQNNLWKKKHWFLKLKFSISSSVYFETDHFIRWKMYMHTLAIESLPEYWVLYELSKILCCSLLTFYGTENVYRRFN